MTSRGCYTPPFLRFHGCIALHLLHGSDWARRESLPAAVEIVKERGWSWQNTLRRVRGGFSDREVHLPDIRVARVFCEIGEMDLAWRLFSVDQRGLKLRDRSDAGWEPAAARGAAPQQEKGKKNQETTSRTQRKTMKLLLSSSSSLTRFAARRFLVT